jgi:raffinose/stachyose/melibiose transport system substrate-binding protein
MNHAFEEGIEHFEQANPAGPKVEVEWVAPSEAQARLDLLIAAGRPPDVSSFDVQQVRRRAAAGHILSLSTSLGEDQEWRSRFPAAALKLLSHDGATYAVPITQTAPVLFYNTFLFQKLQLSPPRTFQELIRAVQALASAGVTPMAFGNNDGSSGTLLSQMILSRLGSADEVQAGLSGRASWPSGQLAAMGNILGSLAAAHAFPEGFDRTKHADAISLFRGGKAGMLFSSERLYAAFDFSGSKVKGQVDLVQFPVIDPTLGDANEWIASPDMNLAVPSASAMKGEAIRFIKTYSTNELQEHFAAHVFLPISRSDLDDAVLLPLMRKFRQLQRTMTGMSLPFESTLEPEVREEYADSIRSLLAGGTSAQAFARLQALVAMKAIPKMASPSSGG